MSVAHKLGHELFLVVVFVLHVYLAVSVTRENRRARPVGYQATQGVGGRNLASYTMIYAGIIVLVFLVLHLKAFKYGDRAEGTLYDLQNERFLQPTEEFQAKETPHPRGAMFKIRQIR